MSVLVIAEWVRRRQSKLPKRKKRKKKGKSRGLFSPKRKVTWARRS